MRRRWFVHQVVAGGLATLGVGTSPIAIHAEPEVLSMDEDSITDAVLGTISPLAAPGYVLRLIRLELPAGWSSGLREYSGATVSCIEAGRLTIELQAGVVLHWRIQDADALSARVIPLNAPVVC